MATVHPFKRRIYNLSRSLIALGVVALASCSGPRTSTAEKLQELGGQPCPESEFTCVTLNVPFDHSYSDKRTIEVTFAVLPASGTSRGVLVTAVGGPGASGVYESDFRLPELDDSIRENLDLVFFDQRGVGMFDDPACPRADEVNNEDYAGLPVEAGPRWDSLIEVTADYVESCTSEMGDPEVLGHLGTDQAIHDLEAFRGAMRYEKLILLGESYGTSFAQQYASAYPEAVERLILDGTMDLTRDGVEGTIDQIDAFQDVMQQVFRACDFDGYCRKDMGRPAGEAYQELLLRLEAEPAMVRFPVEPDVWENLPLTDEDLSYLAFNSAYLEDDRMMFLRALAAWSNRNDLIPMMRLWELTYWSGLDATVSLAATCLDTSVPGNAAEAELDAISASRSKVEPSLRWFYEGLLPCAFWPGVDRTQATPEAFRGEGIPTLIIASETDAATPYSQAVSVYEGLSDGELLTVRGGSHVMFGRGIVCVDEAVTDFILAGSEPATSSCDVEVISPFIPLLPVSHADLEPAELLFDLDNELYYLPELANWNWTDKRIVGCSLGGGLTFTGTEVGADYVLKQCAFSEGLVISGNGSWDLEVGRSRLDVSFEGDPCSYSYTQRWETAAETLEPRC